MYEKQRYLQLICRFSRRYLDFKVRRLYLNASSLLDDKVLDSLMLKTLIDKIFNFAEMKVVFLCKDKMHRGKRRNCWLPAFSLFPKIFRKKKTPHGS